MTAPRATAATAKTIRLIHAGQVAGVVLFGFVAHFVMRPSMADSGEVSPALLPILLGLALAACVVSIVMRRRIPRRSTNDSADLFWTKASTPALLTWAPLEAAGLLAVLSDALFGYQPAIAIATVAVVGLIALAPPFLKRS
jgi:hypothetical protein